MSEGEEVLKEKMSNEKKATTTTTTRATTTILQTLTWQIMLTLQ